MVSQLAATLDAAFHDMRRRLDLRHAAACEPTARAAVSGRRLHSPRGRLHPQHEESFEVRSGAKRKFFYFDENPGRRAVTGRPSKEQALKLAQAYLTKVNHEPGDDDARRPDQAHGR
jgi:hypothetical protein